MKTIINIKADKEVKEQAQKVAAELGLPLSTVINAYLKEFIRNRSINLSVAPRMSKQLEGLLGRVEEDLKHNRNVSPPLSTAKEISKYLSSL